jgi:hypothetical protein
MRSEVGLHLDHWQPEPWKQWPNVAASSDDIARGTVPTIATVVSPPIRRHPAGAGFGPPPR